MFQEKVIEISISVDKRQLTCRGVEGKQDIIDRRLDVISFRRPATGRIGIDGAVLEC
jgi:hypothetical protein